MKINSLRAIFPIAAVTLALSAISCGNKKITPPQISGPQEAPVAFRTDSISWTDSVKAGKNSAICRISVDYPAEGPDSLVGTLRQWIAAQLSASNFVSPDQSAPYSPDTAMLSDGKALIAGIGRTVLDNTLPELRELDSLNIGPDMQYEYYWNITPVYQNGKAITYGNASYCYLGGAHGGASYSPQVFRMTDGRLFGWADMFIPDSIPALRQLVKESLRTTYFDAPSESAFKDALLINPDTLPLPQAQPYFTADGVVFTYGQYEIAPYASGMPSCTLPYAVARPLMTPEAAQLIAE